MPHAGREPDLPKLPQSIKGRTPLDPRPRSGRGADAGLLRHHLFEDTDIGQRGDQDLGLFGDAPRRTAKALAAVPALPHSERMFYFRTTDFFGGADFFR